MEMNDRTSEEPVRGERADAAFADGVKAREMWDTTTEKHKERWVDAGGKRVPMTCIANRRTLNYMTCGFDDAQWSRSEKIVFRTSLGDLYFFEHRMMKDGEVMYL